MMSRILSIFTFMKYFIQPRPQGGSDHATKCSNIFGKYSGELKTFDWFCTFSELNFSSAYSMESVRILLKLRLHTAINWTDFLSLWMRFNSTSIHESTASFSYECTLLPSYVLYNIHQDTTSAWLIAVYVNVYLRLVLLIECNCMITRVNNNKNTS